MDLAKGLVADREDVLSDAAAALQRAHLRHYDKAGAEESRRRLEHLFSLTVDCLAQSTLTPIVSFAVHVAEERFGAGFDIGEVQTAFNVLEEAIWHVVVPRLPPEALADTTARIGTVLGAGKDALARTWVSLASGHHAQSVDLTALIQGAGS